MVGFSSNQTVYRRRLPLFNYLRELFGLVQAEVQEELLEAAEKALAMLDSRRAHHPPEMIDPREGRVAKALRAAVRKVRDGAVGG